MADIKYNVFTVIKKDDATKYLSKEENEILDKLLNKIADSRKNDGKNPYNRYLVCNMDEPYSKDIQDIILKGEQSKNLYECIEDFVIDDVNDEGFRTDKSSIIPKGSLWEFVGKGTMCSEIRLEKAYKNNNHNGMQWIEIGKEHLNQSFKKVNS